eukprot:TRINITY_DN41733_c0_g1_i1.p1 TRINITY_DN41733_c0_g1~~TRINITY_DN41733_c0_g1_i1.p1  ORF type:complete len:263 (-),score=40.88 TRINITY_DN41733_c0_g1_i1:24-734(-)
MDWAALSDEILDAQDQVRENEKAIKAELTHLRPLKQCCCGCSLSFGVTFVLLVNLVRSLYLIIYAWGDVVMRDPTFLSDHSLESQTLSTCFGLLSLPFIFSGFYGVWCRCDSYLRPYLYFTMAAFLYDISGYIIPLAIDGMCAMVPEGLKRVGAAASCGVMRLLFAFCFCQVCVVQCYIMYLVHSLCEDFKVGVPNGYPELLKWKDEQMRQGQRPILGPQQALFGGYNRGTLHTYT